MFQVRAAQMKVFEEDARRRFENEMVLHSRKFSPRLCEVIGEDQLRVVARQAIRRAAAYEFTYRGPIRLFLELMFLFGSDFDTDPQYPALAKALGSPKGQLHRAQQMYNAVLDYQARVSGPDGVNTQRALGTLLDRVRKPLTLGAGGFAPGMLQEMRITFPEKVEYIGREQLGALIGEGQGAAQRYCFTSVRGEVLMVTLMFAFGHGCAADPLYPWIGRTLQDEKIVDPAARADRLERKAVTWLEHVLGAQGKGVSA